jgi:hypothetical protein
MNFRLRLPTFGGAKLSSSVRPRRTNLARCSPISLRMPIRTATATLMPMAMPGAIRMPSAIRMPGLMATTA